MTSTSNLNKIALIDEETVVFEYQRPTQRSNFINLKIKWKKN